MEVIEEWVVPERSFDRGDCLFFSGALSLDGSVFTASFGCQVIVFYRDLQGGDNGEQRHSILRADDGDISSMGVSIDGTLIVPGSERGVKAWRRNVDEWVEYILEGHNEWGKCVTVKEDGKRIATGSQYGTVRVHSWDAGGKKWKHVTLNGHTCSVKGVAIDKEGTVIVSGSFDSTVRVSSEGEGHWQCTAQLEHNDPVSCVSICQDQGEEYILSGDDRGKVNVWTETSDGWTRRVIEGHTGPVTRVTSTNEAIISWSHVDETMRIADRRRLFRRLDVRGGGEAQRESVERCSCR